MAPPTSRAELAAKISAVMLVLGILNWSWGYYDLLRLVVCATAAYLAWQAKQQKSERRMWIMAVIAILYNPIAPVHFERGVWMLLNLAAAAVFWIAATNPRRLL